LSQNSSVFDAAGYNFAPAPAYAQQDAVFIEAFAILQSAIDQHAFPAASVAITRQGKLVALKGLGRFTYAAESPVVTHATVFDLASVSKVVATTSMAMILYERDRLKLETPVDAIVPEFVATRPSKDARRTNVTIENLLAHSSGLPAYEKLYLEAKTKHELFLAALNAPLIAAPGTRAVYSDIGFMVLGLVLERIAGETIDQFCQREVFASLSMSHTTFNPPHQWWLSIPPTANEHSFRKRIIQGEVNDDNAAVLGGVAGHAGAFSSAEDMAIFGNVMLRGGRPLVRPETLARFTLRQSSPEGTSRALGWDTPSSPSQSGKYFSARSFGHLGYSGTSLWIDPVRDLSVTLLTNRTWPDASNPAIRQIRPHFHDAVVEALNEQAREAKG
jgi:CubicO group peptidase (beta-lactamase class C family)